MQTSQRQKLNMTMTKTRKMWNHCASARTDSRLPSKYLQEKHNQTKVTTGWHLSGKKRWILNSLVDVSQHNCSYTHDVEKSAEARHHTETEVRVFLEYIYIDKRIYEIQIKGCCLIDLCS